jgi:Domain of unknown function (DUF4259)
MGAWGTGLFENDEALDFAGDVVERGGLTLVENVLEELLDMGDEYVEAPEAEQALVAAEIVAALAGRPAAEYPDELTEWLDGLDAVPDSALVDTARRAVQRVLTPPCELLELWEEAGEDDYGEWRVGVEAIAARL